jgi:urease accessory protein
MFLQVERTLGKLSDFRLEGRALERLRIPSSAMTRRILRLPSSIGDLGVVLDGHARLRDGDVLVADERRVIAVEVEPDDVLVAYPGSIGEAVEVAHALGNRHVPLQRDGDAIVVAYADALRALLERLGVRYERTSRVLEQPFVHASAPHSHG